VHAFLGLRGRLVLALVAVAVVALAGATVALFTPLEQRVQRDALGSLAASAETARQEMAALPRSALRSRSPQLSSIAHRLHRVGVEVFVLDRAGHPLLGTDQGLDRRVPFPQLTRTLRSRREVREIVGEGANAEAITVLPIDTRAGDVTLGLRKSLKDVAAARQVFLVGFERAAVLSLAIAVLLGFLLATGLVRRIRRLRSAAVRVAQEGPGAELPADRSRDEIGDLARAFGRMQRRLHAQEEARKAFVATASHELRTPIAALRLRLGLLREDLAAVAPDLDDAREQVAHADEQAGRLARLAADLLDLSRLDAEVPLLREPVPLASLCHATVAEFQGGARAPIALFDARAGTAMGDPGKIAQIVRILVDNARRYAPPERPIRVAIDGSSIAVENDGPAIPVEERELIFERFRRGADQDGHPGFGLGLAIGRGLAQRMGGDLLLAHAGDPTRFELRLTPAPQQVLAAAGRG